MTEPRQSVERKKVPQTPRIGLIVPPTGDLAPPEAQLLFPDVDFVARGLGIKSMAPRDFSLALEGLETTVSDLLSQGVDAISLLGISLTFYEGKDGNEEIERRIGLVANDVPTTTLSSSIVRSLSRINAKKIAVIAAYDTDMTGQLVSFLEESSFTVDYRSELGLISMKSVQSLSNDDLMNFVIESVSQMPTQPDAILVSCGGLRTIDLSSVLSRYTSSPVVSSSVDGILDVVRLVGIEV